MSPRSRSKAATSFPSGTGVSRNVPWAFAVAALLFGSGLCALTYQVAWLRLLRLIFGYSTGASAAVLAIFMGGLGLGAIYWGRRVDRQRRTLRYYAWLELGIAATAAISPIWISMARSVYLASGGTAVLGRTMATIFSLLLSALVLGLPTFLMGGTLAAAARAIETSQGHRNRTALLYASNTLGAVTGVLLTNFVFLEAWGNRRTLYSAAALNGGIAILAFILSRFTASSADDSEEASDDSSPTDSSSRLFLLLTSGACGGAFLLMELVWYRALAPILGGSTYTFGIILALALLGIGLGGLIYAQRRPEGASTSFSWLACVTALEAVGCIFPFALGDRVALLAVALHPLGITGFGSMIACWVVITSIVVLPMSIVSGYQFPLLIGMMGSGTKRVGSEVGALYATNAAGAILGSIVGGFWILPGVGILVAWKSVSLALIVVSIAAVGLAFKRNEARSVTPIAGLAVTVIFLLCTTAGPSAVWRHTPIGAGLVHSIGSTPNEARAYLHEVRRNVVWEQDGVESSVAVTDANAYSLNINGKSDGNAVADRSTIVMAGILPTLYQEAPRRALVVGLGLGVTAGWLTQIPSIETVDVIELEPSVLRAVQDSAPANWNVLSNPKVHIHIGDAREFLLTTRQRYDLIVSEPSNPYRAGVASLFTVEFYEAAIRALSENGSFAQWLQMYAVDSRTVQTVYATMAATFPTVESWEVQLGNDLLLVARRGEQTHDLAELARRLESEPYRSALRAAWGIGGIEGLYSGFVAGPEMARRFSEQTPTERLNTDDTTRIEFEFARSLGRADVQLLRNLREAASQQANFAPPLRNGSIDWQRVSEQRAARALHELKPFAADGYFGSTGATRRVTARYAYAEYRLPDALQAWRQQGEEPENYIDVVLVAESFADAGDPAYRSHVERLRAWSEADANFVSALYHWRQGDLGQATSFLVQGFEKSRESIDVYPRLLERSLSRAESLASQRQESATPLRLALAKPFAVHLMEERRRLAHSRLALRSADPADCESAIAAMEPWIPWNEAFLRDRLTCFERRQDPRLSQAKDDLNEFLALAPGNFFFDATDERPR